MSSNWVDRTNYYSLPRPYNRNRKSVQGPPEHQMPEQYGLFIPTPISPGKEAARDVIKAHVFVHDGSQNSGTPNSFLSPSSEHSNFIFPGAAEGVYSSDVSPQGNMMKELKELKANKKKKKDRYSFYNDLLELEKRGHPLPSRFIRLDPNSNGPGRYFAYVPTNNPDYWTELPKRGTDNGHKSQMGPEIHPGYVKDIAGAHLPIYQRLGAFHGSSSNEVMSQRFKAETLGGRFIRRSAHLGPRNILRPASVTPDHWWERERPAVMVTPKNHVAEDLYIRAEVTNPVTSSVPRGHRMGQQTTHRRSRSAAPRPHSVYYF